MATQNAVDTSLAGQTGTGNFVGATSPTLITPLLGTPASGTLTNCTGLPIAGTTGYGTGVATALAANVTGSGGIALKTSAALTTPVITGVTDGSSAASGIVGEVLSSSFASAVAITTATPTQVQTLTLTAGDWDVWGILQANPAGGTTIQVFIGNVYTSSATFPSFAGVSTSAHFEQFYTVGSAGGGLLTATSILPTSVSTNTTIYLNGQINYSGSTCTISGMIIARRVR